MIWLNAQRVFVCLRECVVSCSSFHFSWNSIFCLPIDAVLHFNKTRMHNGIRRLMVLMRVKKSILTWTKKSLHVLGVYLCSMYSKWICANIPQIFDEWQKNRRFTVKPFFHLLFQIERLTNNLEFHTIRAFATHFTRTDKLINSILTWHRWQLLFVLFWIACTVHIYTMKYHTHCGIRRKDAFKNRSLMYHKCYTYACLIDRMMIADIKIELITKVWVLWTMALTFAHVRKREAKLITEVS